ncbi:MAG: PAS domain S-box protein, partial [Myxococcota bacterium]
MDPTSDFVEWGRTPESLAPSEFPREAFERRLLHCARFAERNEDEVHFEQVGWSGDTPLLFPVLLEPSRAGPSTAWLGEPREFDMTLALGPLALEILRSIKQVVLLTETEPSCYPGPRVLFANEEFERMTGYSAADIVGKTPRILQGPDTDPNTRARIAAALAAWERVNVELVNYHSDGRAFLVELDITPLSDATGWWTYWCSVQRDITSRRQTDAERHHQQKLESIGQLAAGIAHEINTPIQFVSDNNTFLTDSLPPLIRVAEQFDELITRCENGSVDNEFLEQARSLLNEAQLDFVSEQVPRALEQSHDGLARVAKIVLAMKEFSHPSEGQKQGADLNALIETALTVSRNEWKYVAQVETELSETLPMVPCHRDELNQVLLNLLVNAAHAIADNHADGELGTITVRT